MLVPISELLKSTFELLVISWKVVECKEFAQIVSPTIIEFHSGVKASCIKKEYLASLQLLPQPSEVRSIKAHEKKIKFLINSFN